MRKFALAMAACLIIVPGCEAKKPREPRYLIVGKWESTDPKAKGTHEYKSDGTLIVVQEVRGRKVEMIGSYEFIEDEVMVVEVDPGGGLPKMNQRIRVKITDDELTTTDDLNQVGTMKRVKK